MKWNFFRKKFETFQTISANNNFENLRIVEQERQQEENKHVEARSV